MNEIVLKNGETQTSTPESKQEQQLWLVDQLTVLGEVLLPPLTKQKLLIYVSDLADLSREQLSSAVMRARRELEFFPTIAKLREFSGAGTPEQKADAEALMAWEEVTAYVDKWVQATPEGQYLPEERYGKLPPKLSARIDSAVRRCRGWKAFKCRTEGDEPFLRKDFIEAYKLGEIAEHIPLDRLLVSPSVPVKRLAGEVCNASLPQVKTMPKASPKSEPTEAECMERKRIAKELAAKLITDRASKTGQTVEELMAKAAAIKPEELQNGKRKEAANSNP